MEKIITVRYPHYYKKFSCTGSRCEDTCCASWGVSIDPVSLRRYRENAMQKKQFQQNMKDKVRVFEDGGIRLLKRGQKGVVKNFRLHWKTKDLQN